MHIPQLFLQKPDSHQMEAAIHQQVHPKPIGTRRLATKIHESPLCYLTTNQSEN